MKPAFLLILTVFLSCLFLNSFSQRVNTRNPDEIKKNFLKVNLTALALKNYSFQYERAFTKTLSVAVSYRTMPNTTLPFKAAIEEAIAEEGDQETVNAIRDLKMENFAITPEVRFYLGKKGWGRGFYIAPFYRYAEFKVSNIAFEYGDNPAIQNKIALSGKLTANTGGLAFGAQWALGKVIVLDWCIVGPHYGGGKGDFAGASSRLLTPAEQLELRQDLENLDIPFTDKTVNVTASGASMKLDGPWGGARAAISLGIRL